MDAEESSHILFERYADDVICHCKSEAEAERLLSQIVKRMAECKLELNLEKTQIVYCKDDRRKGNYPRVKFDFLGFSFQPRVVKARNGDIFVGFTPAMSNKAAKAMREKFAAGIFTFVATKALRTYLGCTIRSLRGWVNYYGSYTRSKLYQALQPFHLILVKWAMRKYKRFKGHQRRASRWLLRIRKRSPYLFAHWQMARKCYGWTIGAV